MSNKRLTYTPKTKMRRSTDIAVVTLIPNVSITDENIVDGRWKFLLLVFQSVVAFFLLSRR